MRRVSRLGRMAALARGVFISGEPLVEHAGYMLDQPGLASGERMRHCRRFASSSDTGRIFGRLMTEKDGALQEILAEGYFKGFVKALDEHLFLDTSQYPASAMLSRLDERRKYVLEVEGQCRDYLGRSWRGTGRSREMVLSVLVLCEALRDQPWMQP
jgi:hypothetical protein